MSNNRIKAVFTDLDRTLLTNIGTISKQNLAAIELLREKGILLIIATGRNLLSAKKVLNDEHLFDMLMFSSGAGIINWKTKELIYKNHISSINTQKAIDILLENEIDFMVHDVIPENHRFKYWVHHDLSDFKRRIKLYELYAQPLKLDIAPKQATQLLAVLKQDQLEKFEQLNHQLDFVKVIRTTSPLDQKSIWLEIFPKNISKGHTAKWLCNRLNILREETVGIGNDFNDLDLLEFTSQSYVVDNAPNELKAKYLVIPSNDGNGFAKCINKIICDL